MAHGIKSGVIKGVENNLWRVAMKLNASRSAINKPSRSNGLNLE